jgi:hypothetical protein
MSKPTHIAYVVNENKARATNPEAKDFWREVGVVWPHKSGSGFDIVLFDQLSVSGRIVCTERKEKEKADQQ